MSKTLEFNNTSWEILINTMSLRLIAEYSHGMLTYALAKYGAVNSPGSNRITFANDEDCVYFKLKFSV